MVQDLWSGGPRRSLSATVSPCQQAAFPGGTHDFRDQIPGIKKEHSSSGAPKIRYKLIREFPMIQPPAVSTVHAVLDRNSLVKRRKRPPYKAKGTELAAAHAPNGLWCANFKGEFMLGNKQYCHPLTITDYRSRFFDRDEGAG